jgi:hypothetical protein
MNFKQIFCGEGYKDGIYGLALSLLQASSELVLYLKVQAEKFKDQNRIGRWYRKCAKRKRLALLAGDSMYKKPVG